MSQPGRWFAPLTGVVFVATLVAWGVLAGGTPGLDLDEIADFYTENNARVMFGSMVLGIGAVFFLFFVGCLWRVLRSADDTLWLAAVTLVGGAVATVGILMIAGLGVILTDIPGFVDPAAAQTIHVLATQPLYMPVSGGMAVLLFATGLLIIRTKVLPLWLGWAAFVLTAGCMSRAGFAAFLASAVWVLVVSVLLTRRPAPALRP